MLENYTNTKKQGDAGLGSAISYFTMKGYPVSIPLTDNQDYDLVVEIDKVLKKVQVKTTKYKSKHGNYVISLSVKCGYWKGSHISKWGNEVEYDLLFILTGDDQKYLIEKEFIKEIKSALTLGDKYQKFSI